MPPTATRANDGSPEPSRDLVAVGPGDALIVADGQRDFLPGGALGIARGDEVVPILNRRLAHFAARGATTVATRDWHPPNHVSFRSRGGPWPPHCVLAAPGRLLVEFGLRRAHGAEAGLLAARSAYIAGFAGTSNVLAGPLYGIPLFGTMAHSFVQAHEAEDLAFERFAEALPRQATLLIDTYDTAEGARAAVRKAAGGPR